MPISGSEALVLLIIAVLVVGPERLPAYAEQLGRLVRQLKDMATGAQDRLRSELGDDLPDLTSLDPRRYDPRRIVREALLDPPAGSSAAGPLGPRTGSTAVGAAGAAAAARAGGTGTAGSTAAGATGRPPAPRPLAAGEIPPFDDEAT